AGATDEQDEWIGGDLVLVQLGDFIGRSYQDREVLDFILEVREKAEAGGGSVHALIGNHEVFGARLELRWVPDEAYPAFSNIPDLDLDNPHLAELPEYKRARGAALMPGGYYAKQLAEFPAVLRLGETIYVHGGVTPHWARYGIDRINQEVSRWFAGHADEPTSAQGMNLGNYDDIVMMSRHFSKDVDENDCVMLEEFLKLLNAKRMIVAHSVQDSITARCDEKVWAVDVGMSRYYGGYLQVLEIINDDILSVIEY
ncbi:MAG: metallophosphoesterase, partial [Xanthomonadales bacterium]